MTRKCVIALALLTASCATTPSAPSEQVRLRAQAERVTITRDDWGIAHVRGVSDADAVRRETLLGLSSRISRLFFKYQPTDIEAIDSGR